MKDCCIKSIKDKKIFDQEMDQFFRRNSGPPNAGLSANQTNPTQEKTATNDQSFLEKGDFLD